MQFPHSAGMNGDHRHGRGRDFEIPRIDNADVTALGLLCRREKNLSEVRDLEWSRLEIDRARSAVVFDRIED